MQYRDDFSSPSPPLAARLASHEPCASLVCHPSIVPSLTTTAGDASGDGQDIGTLAMLLSQASATIHEMHVEVSVAEADQERVAALAEIAGNYCYDRI